MQEVKVLSHRFSINQVCESGHTIFTINFGQVVLEELLNTLIQARLV